MRISYIIVRGFKGGGIEVYTKELAIRLAQKDHKIRIYTIKGYEYDHLENSNISIKEISAVKTRSLEKITSMLIATIHESIDNKSDIIHYHAFGPSFLCIIPKVLKRKILVQGHGLEWKRKRWSTFGRYILKITEKISVNTPSIVTVVSKTLQKYIKEKYGINSVYIPTGVNVQKYYPPNLIKEKYNLKGNDYILFVARLVKEKGAHYLINAYKKIKTDFKLVIAGDAKYEERYKNELLNLAGGDDNIIFTGFVNGELLKELFSNCYIYVLPSEIEGLPTSLIEAMSFGNCCLVSDINENIEAINGYGYTFKVGDVDDLKNKIKMLIMNQEQVRDIKDKAKDYVTKKYSWDIIAEHYEKVYYELLNR